MFRLRAKLLSSFKQLFEISDSAIYCSEVLALWPVQLHILPDSSTWVDDHFDHFALPK